MQKNSTFLTDKQLAARYNVHRTTIWRWVRNGSFPQPDRIGDGCTRWGDAKVFEWEEKSLERA